MEACHLDVVGYNGGYMHAMEYIYISYMLLCITYMHAVLWVTYVSSASYLFNPQTASHIDSLSRHSFFCAGEEINKKMTPTQLKRWKRHPKCCPPSYVWSINPIMNYIVMCTYIYHKS